MIQVLYNILIEFGILMKLVRLIKMCLNETFSRVRVGKNLSDILPLTFFLLKQVWKEETLYLQLFFNSTLEYAVRRVQVNYEAWN